jgi:hypothetical protein
MRKLPRPQFVHLVQLGLFQRPPDAPQWRQLPREIRQHAVQLMARMMLEHREHVERRRAMEADDE